MTDDPTPEVERLDAVLKAAGPAHHAAYVATDGEDPEWPLWYADHVLENVTSILGRAELTRSRLVWAFVSCDHAFVLAAPPVPWHRFYAEWFVQNL
jgi:hypothetical protein